MGIREVLQTEIWSKETSRKILKRIWKVLVGLKYVGIGLGVVVLGFVSLCLVWTHWLTAKERNLGRIALAQLDALQNSDEMSDAEFDEQAKRAQQKVDAASHVAFTGKDREIALYLDSYLYELKDVRFEKKMLHKISASITDQKRLERQKEFEMKEEESARIILAIFRDPLHESLDK